MTAKNLLELVFYIFCLAFIYWCGYREGYNNGVEDTIYYPEEEEIFNVTQLPLPNQFCQRSANGDHCDCSYRCCWCNKQINKKEQ